MSRLRAAGGARGSFETERQGAMVSTSFGPAVASAAGKLTHAIVEFFAIAAVYFAVAKLSLALASINPSATPIWPPTGFALAAVLLRGYRVSAAIFLAALITNATTAGSINTSLAIAAGNTLEGLVGAYLINRWSDGQSTFRTPGRVARFALICLAPSTVISATVGVVSLSLAGYANWSDFAPIWMTWWMGDLAGALVIAPVLVLWATASVDLARGRELIRSGLVFLAAVAVGLVAFSPLLQHSADRGPLAFLAILPLMWAALRRNQRDTATTTFILSCFAVWGTVSGDGPFARSSQNDSFLLLLTFLISISVPSLALSAEVAMRKRDIEHVRFVMRELSHRSKNLLSVVQGMAFQVARQNHNFDDFQTAFTTRLRAFAETHDLLVAGDWQGVDFRTLIRTHLAPFRDLDRHTVLLDGPELSLAPKAAEQLGLALHELATNAIKHGAFTVPAGTVNIRWEPATEGPDKEYLRISWKEHGGPIVREPGGHHGFGHLVVTQIVPMSLGGTASLDFEPGGIKWVLLIPRSAILARQR